MGRPAVYYSGTTKYDPDKCYNGFTLIPGRGYGPMIIDMNGKVHHLWKNLQGEPNKLIKGGYVVSSRGVRSKDISHQDRIDLVVCDYDGNVVWEYDHGEFCEDEGHEPRWMLRQHHDFQIEGNPVGYHSPALESKPDFNKVLILCHRDVLKERISPQLLEDDRIIEIDRSGNELWSWNCADHFNEFGFTEIQKNSIYRNPNTVESGPHGQGDLFHINTASYVGPNKWFDQGDERFNPENIIMGSREACIIFIVSHKTKKIVWQIGPDYSSSKQLRRIGAIIGSHNAHIIPKGLPGEGNLLLFDNGGWAGYGLPDQVSKTGNLVSRRDYSRVLEIDPITLDVVWEFNPSKMGYKAPFNAHFFYSPLVSNAQRLPNGNTMITEGVNGRIFEVTPDDEVVWDYISPYFDASGNNMIYRAYRIPYDYVPQAVHSKEKEVIAPDSARLRLENADDGNIPKDNIKEIEGTWDFAKSDSFCVEKI